MTNISAIALNFNVSQSIDLLLACLAFLFAILADSWKLFLCTLPLLVLWQWGPIGKKKATSLTYKIGVLVFAYYLCGIFYLTGIFFSTFRFAPYFNFIPFYHFSSSKWQYLMNTFLFLPLGVLSPLLWKKFQNPIHTIFFGLGVSFFIEVAQMFFNRLSDVNDLMMNTLGAFIGWCIWFVVSLVWKKSKHIALSEGNESWSTICMVSCSATLVQLLFSRYL